MSLADAFAPVDALYRQQVMQATWGHLAPEPRRKYQGTILFTESEYGDLVAIRVQFADLPDSPWFFDALNDFICSRSTEPGGIYLFSGTYMMRKNGTHQFSGKLREVGIRELNMIGTAEIGRRADFAMDQNARAVVDAIVGQPEGT